MVVIRLKAQMICLWVLHFMVAFSGMFHSGLAISIRGGTTGHQFIEATCVLRSLGQVLLKIK